MHITTRKLTAAAVTGAAYAALTMLLAPISYGAIQCRVSEVLCILAALMPVVFNFVFVGAVLTWSLTDAVFPHLNASFWIFGGQVALGEVAVLGVLGLPLMRLLPRNPKFREIIRSYQKE